jgi:hypothetical protein
MLPPVRKSKSCVGPSVDAVSSEGWISETCGFCPRFKWLVIHLPLFQIFGQSDQAATSGQPSMLSAMTITGFRCCLRLDIANEQSEMTLCLESEIWSAAFHNVPGFQSFHHHSRMILMRLSQWLLDSPLWLSVTEILIKRNARWNGFFGLLNRCSFLQLNRIEINKLDDHY